MENVTIRGNLLNTGNVRVKPFYVFAGLWVMMFILYLPAVKGGWVSDPVESLDRFRHWSFRDFVTLKESRGNAYYLTQLMDYLLFRTAGTNPWAWHLLFLTMQAVNATLIYSIFTKLFSESGVKNGIAIAGGAVILFCIAPHLSEVLVWRACFHYFQAMLLILLILRLVQQFESVPKAGYAFCAVVLFFLSTFSDEFFFLTLFFVLTLLWYYRNVLGYSKEIFKKGLLYFLLPIFIVTVLHVLMPKIASGSYASNLGDEAHQTLTGYLRKPPLYIFHTLFFGRFFTHDTRQMVYDFVGAKSGLAIVYGLFACLWTFIILRFKKMKPSGKSVVLIFTWLQLSIAIVCTVWFPETLLVNFDRYSYFMLPFIYLLVMFVLVSIRIKEWGITFFIVYAFINVNLTIKVNKYWGQSAHVVNGLLHSVPPVDNKIVLLLNVPEYMNGVPMVGPFLHYSFRQMYNLYNERQINNQMFDVISYNMSGSGDGAHVNVYGDNLMHVTLNQWGTWWWYGMWGAFSYENEYYKVNMIDMGHWYELTLKKPANEYLILYNVGDKWKTVDWNKKNDDQN